MAKTKKKPEVKPLTPRQTLLDPSAPMRGKVIGQVADQIIKGTYRPQEHAIRQEIADVRTQDTALADRAAGYYKDLAGSDQASQARQAALSAMLNDNLKSVGQESRDRMAASDAATNSVRTADLARRNAPDDGNLSAEQAALSKRLEGQVSGAQAVGMKQGANYEGLLNAMAQSRQMRGGEIQGDLLNKLANDVTSRRGKLTELQAGKGAKRLETILSLRGQQQASDLAQQKLLTDASIARGKLLSAKEIAQIRSDATTDSATIRADATTAAANSRAAAAQDKADAAKTEKEKAAAKKAAEKAHAEKHDQIVESRKRFEDVTTTLSKINSGLQIPITKPDPQHPGKTITTGHRAATTDETIRQLRSEGLPEWVIQAAISLRHHNGKLTPEVVRLIHTQAPGLIIPKAYRPVRVRPSKGATTHPRT